MPKDDLPVPIFVAEFIDNDVTEHVQVKMCNRRHRGESIDHFNASFTYISNGAHIDMRMDNIVKVHYVGTKDKLKTMLPEHHLVKGF